MGHPHPHSQEWLCHRLFESVVTKCAEPTLAKGARMGQPHLHSQEWLCHRPFESVVTKCQEPTLAEDARMGHPHPHSQEWLCHRPQAPPPDFCFDLHFRAGAAGAHGLQMTLQITGRNDGR